MGDRRREKGGGAGSGRQESGDRRRKTGEGRLETEDGSQETGEGAMTYSIALPEHFGRSLCEVRLRLHLK